MTSIDTVAATTMRVVCGKDELAEKLQVAGRGVSTRTAVQILAGIMLRAAAGGLHSARPTWRSPCATRSKPRSRRSRQPSGSAQASAH